MDLNALKLFILAVKTGSLTATADKLAMPISTLSRKIGELEKQLNIQLLERTRQGIVPTTAGKRLYEQTYLNIESLISVENTANFEHALKGNLRLSIPPNFDIWNDLLTDFSQQYPDIDLFCHSSEYLVDLAHDQIDVALRIGALHTDSVIAKPIFSVQGKLVASPAFIERFGCPQKPQDLNDYPLAGWASLNQRLDKLQLGRHSIIPHYHYASTNSQSLYQFAQKGLAISNLSNLSVQKHLANGSLIEVLADYPQPTYPVHLIYPSHRYPSAIARAYIDFCFNWVEQYFK